MMVKSNKYSFIMPCYNSSNTIEKLVEMVFYEMKNLGKLDFEIVLVNDCSPDGGKTISILRELPIKYPFVKVVDLAKNVGQHNAIMAGLRCGEGTVYIGMDDDMQTHPTQIGKLIKKFEEGYDLVYGYYPQKRHNFFRNLGSKINSLTSHIFMNKPAHIHTSSFWIIRKFVRDSVIEYTGSYSYMSGLFLRATNNACSVPVEHFKREHGKSNYNFKKLFQLWSNIIGFSVKPLRMATVCGYVLAIGSVLAILFIVIRRMIYPSASTGWASLMSVMLLSCGLNLIFLGMVGEYVGRIFLGINQEPQYVIKEIIESNEKQKEGILE